MGSSCFARGNGANLERIEHWIGERGLAVSIDLLGCRCRGECTSGPVLELDGHLHRGVDEGMLWDLLEHYFPEAEQETGNE